MYFANYMYHGTLFLSIFLSTCIRAKANIHFASLRNNVIKEAVNAFSLRIMSLQIQYTCGFLILKGSSFKFKVSNTQHEYNISSTANLKKSMKTN
ncbi:hypothetical protein QL285_072760 [Trifolium repens]|nr:hypothetical protein QL285_072760 [Trifolium repens]